MSSSFNVGNPTASSDKIGRPPGPPREGLTTATAAVIGVVGGVTFLIVVAIVAARVYMCRKRRRPPPTQELKVQDLEQGAPYNPSRTPPAPAHPVSTTSAGARTASAGSAHGVCAGSARRVQPSRASGVVAVHSIDAMVHSHQHSWSAQELRPQRSRGGSPEAPPRRSGSANRSGRLIYHVGTELLQPRRSGDGSAGSHSAQRSAASSASTNAVGGVSPPRSTVMRAAKQTPIKVAAPPAHTHGPPPGPRAAPAQMPQLAEAAPQPALQPLPQSAPHNMHAGSSVGLQITGSMKAVLQ